ncbi:concanavalin A-like lectin/glucanase domain-containing protein [Stachybotrys elegans]|uniref:Endo-1,4-beta-xylanase n=1 Tax=Stachybotrys elegans TaxID=80388 RepID=A0A8K0WJE9_9HYPO|nr:concanavalin A-like lectin/glucanase domain-containing protein [Stachybotrys elegans]
MRLWRISSVTLNDATLRLARGDLRPSTGQSWYSSIRHIRVKAHPHSEFADLDWVSGPAGRYSVDWNQGFGGNFVVGKGYRPGGDIRIVNYTGTFRVSGRAYLALYGWTTNPLVEWYVIESMGVHNPSDNSNATCYGTLESDGGTYEVWMKWRINAPSIIGDADFQQFWSIRTMRHVGGTINTTRHFEAYRKAGLRLGRHNFLALAIEGQQGNGAANITVGVAPSTAVPQSTTSRTRTEVPVRTNTCLPKL